MPSLTQWQPHQRKQSTLDRFFAPRSAPNVSPADFPPTSVSLIDSASAVAHKSLSSHVALMTPEAEQSTTSSNANGDEDDDEDVPLAAFLFDRPASSPPAPCATAPTADVGSCAFTEALNAVTHSVEHPTASLHRKESFVEELQHSVAYPLTSSYSTTPTPTHSMASPHTPSSAAIAVRCPPPRLTQTTLDLSQRGSTHLGQRCPRCCMVYNLNAEDVEVHARYCRAQQRRRRRLEGEEAWRGTGEERQESQFAAFKASSPSSLCDYGGMKGATAKSSEATELQISAKAVQLLEALRRLPFRKPSRAHVQAAGSRMASATAARSKKRNRQAAANINILDGTLPQQSPTSRTKPFPHRKPFMCFRVPSPPSSAASLHPLDVLVVQQRREPGDGPSAPSHEGDGTLTRLMSLLGFTQHLWAPSASTTSSRRLIGTHHQRHGIDDNRSDHGDADDGATTIVFVIDVVLQLVMCAAVGRAKQREQDPELCVRQRADGSTTCGTRRCFTYGDVVDLWVLPPCALTRAQEEWEAKTAAPFTSTQDAVRRFFQPSRSTQNGASERGEKDDGDRDELFCFCQRALGVAVHTLARHLLYGRTLCPFTQLSYARSVVRASAAFCRTSIDGYVKRDIASCADEWMQECLCAAAPLDFDTANGFRVGRDRATVALTDDAPAEATRGPLNVHADAEGDVAEEEGESELKRTCELIEGTAEMLGGRRGRWSAASPSSLSHDGRGVLADVDDNSLSVVSYSSES